MLQPEDLLITPAFYQRQARSPDLNTELDAYRELSSLMTVDPVAAIQRFLDLAIELCPAAGSAGLSEISEGADGEPIFLWTTMSGAFAPYVGGTPPRDFSPCGLCLDHHHSILVERPGRVFAYFDDAVPGIVEGLVVPLYDTGKRPIGTLWVISHNDGAQLDPTDARIMEQLAVQLVLAIKLRRKAQVMVQLKEVARDREVLVEEVRHRVKNMIQMTSGLLQLQERGLNSEEARAALRDAQSRLLVLASVYEALLLPGADSRQFNVGALIDTLGSALREGSPHGRRVKLRTECESLLIPVEKAVPVGLIVNEAVTNALKHAFDGKEGEVVVRLRKSGKRCSLIIADDGSGFEEPLREDSLGLRLIRNLARQLRAELSIDGSTGTTVHVEWTMSDKLAEARAEMAEIAVG